MKLIEIKVLHKEIEEMLLCYFYRIDYNKRSILTTQMSGYTRTFYFDEVDKIYINGKVLHEKPLEIEK